MTSYKSKCHWDELWAIKWRVRSLCLVRSHICITRNWDLCSAGQQCGLYQLQGLFKLYKAVLILEEPHFRLLKQKISLRWSWKAWLNYYRNDYMFCLSKIWLSVMKNAVQLNSFQFNQSNSKLFFWLCMWLNLTLRVYQVLTLKLTEI